MIWVAGESLIDMLAIDQDGQRNFRPVVGGSPYNVSLALGRLGVPVQYLCRISEDPFGQMLARTLEQSGVDLSLCPRTAALSTLGFVLIEGEQRNANYVFYTDGTAGSALEPGDIPAPLPPEVRGLHFGSISLLLEPICFALEKLLAQKTSHTLVSIDPNIRAFLVRDRAGYLKRLNQFLAQADLIRMSEEDLAWMHPGMSADDCCQKYISTGAGLVVVTRGERGAIARNACGEVEIPAPITQVIDTVGAGDTFQAAMLAWLFWKYDLRVEALARLEPAELKELLQFAAQAAAITCSRAGCNPPWRKELLAPAS